MVKSVDEKLKELEKEILSRCDDIVNNCSRESMRDYFDCFGEISKEERIERYEMIIEGLEKVWKILEEEV